MTYAEEYDEREPICTCGHVLDEHYDDGHECGVLGCDCQLFVEDPGA